MSTKSYSIDGMGFHPTEISEKNLRKFCIKHRDTLEKNEYGCWKELLDVLDGKMKDEWDSLSEYLEEYEAVNFSSYGVFAFIADIMQEETNICFEFQSSTDDSDINAILLEDSCPWSWNEAEKNLTHDSFKKICNDYAKELGMDKSALDVDRVSLEMYG